MRGIGLMPQQVDQSVGQIRAGTGQIDPRVANINAAQSDQARAGQMDVASMFRNMAMGQGPSLAQGVLQEGLGQSMRNAMSMGLGAQQRGMSPGSAMRAAMRARAMASADAMNQAAQLRSAEQMGAMGQLGNLYGGMRGQDIGLASQQASNNMGIAGQNANNALGLAGQNAQNAMAAQQMQLQANQQATENLQKFVGGIGQGVAAVATGGASLVPGAAMGGLFGPGGLLGGPEKTYTQRGGVMTPAPATGGNFIGGAYSPRGYASGGRVPCYAMGGGPLDPGGARMPKGVDSSRFDVVPAMLSPGEIVLPRSVAQDDDAPERAKAFVEALKKSKTKRAA